MEGAEPETIPRGKVWRRAFDGILRGRRSESESKEERRLSCVTSYFYYSINLGREQLKFEQVNGTIML